MLPVSAPGGDPTILGGRMDLIEGDSVNSQRSNGIPREFPLFFFSSSRFDTLVLYGVTNLLLNLPLDGHGSS